MILIKIEKFEKVLEGECLQKGMIPKMALLRGPSSNYSTGEKRLCISSITFNVQCACIER